MLYCEAVYIEGDGEHCNMGAGENLSDDEDCSGGDGEDYDVGDGEEFNDDCCGYDNDVRG